MSRPGPDPSVDDEEIVRTLVVAYKPVLGTSEIAEEIGLSRQATTRHLKRLEEEGMLVSDKVGPVTIWWPTDEGKRLLQKDS